MNLLISVSCILELLSACSAHLCLVSPQQRGSMMGLDKAGSSDCILLKGPCGGRMAMDPKIMWQSGQNFTVIFQKNLDHWAKATPGYFSVNLMSSSMTKELVRVPDMGEPSLHLYTAMGMLPNDIAAMTYTLQVVYMTMNPQAPAMFYQCADVMVKSFSGWTVIG